MTRQVAIWFNNDIAPLVILADLAPSTKPRAKRRLEHLHHVGRLIRRAAGKSEDGAARRTRRTHLIELIVDHDGVRLLALEMLQRPPPLIELGVGRPRRARRGDLVRLRDKVGDDRDDDHRAREGDLDGGLLDDALRVRVGYEGLEERLTRDDGDLAVAQRLGAGRVAQDGAREDDITEEVAHSKEDTPTADHAVGDDVEHPLGHDWVAGAVGNARDAHGEVDEELALTSPEPPHSLDDCRCDLVAHVTLQLVGEALAHEGVVALALEEALRLAEELAHRHARVVRHRRVGHHEIKGVEVLTPRDLVGVAVGHHAANHALYRREQHRASEDGDEEEGVLVVVRRADGGHPTDELKHRDEQPGHVDGERGIFKLRRDVTVGGGAACPRLCVEDVPFWLGAHAGEGRALARGEAALVANCLGARVRRQAPSTSRVGLHQRE